MCITTLDRLVEVFSEDRVKAAINYVALQGKEVARPILYIKTYLENEMKEKVAAGEQEKDKKTAPTDTRTPSPSPTPPNPTAKVIFPQAPNVSFSYVEAVALVDKFGPQGTANRADFLSMYKEASGKKYRSDYAQILLLDRRGDSNGCEWDPEQVGWIVNTEWVEDVRAYLKKRNTQIGAAIRR